MQIATQLLHNFRRAGILLCARSDGRRFERNASVYNYSAIILVAGVHRKNLGDI